MFSSTKKKVMAVAVMTTMALAGFGTLAAQAHDLPDHVCTGPAGTHNPHCDPDHDNGGGGGGGEHEHECETISIEVDGIELDICLLVDLDIDIDELLDILHLLHYVDAHDRLEWLHGHLDLGDKIDWLRGKIDLEDLFDKLDWLEPGTVFGLIGYLGDGVGNHADGLLETDLLGDILDGDGGSGGGGGDCTGLVNVCNNANGIDLGHHNSLVDLGHHNDVLSLTELGDYDGLMSLF